MWTRKDEIKDRLKTFAFFSPIYLFGGLVVFGMADLIHMYVKLDV